MNKELKYYINYPINSYLIYKLIDNLNINKINFFIDLNGICKGFYKESTVLYEINEYLEKQQVSGKLIVELKSWLNNLYKLFNKKDLYFIIFYDNGQCLQNKLIDSTYKANRQISNLIIDEDKNTTEIFRGIKRYYYEKIVEEISKPDLCSVIYSKDYETDLVPHYCIKNNLFDSSEKDVLNIIISLDKDLIQTTDIDNVDSYTVVTPTGFKADKETRKYKLNFRIYDKKNGLQYIYKKFQPGIITSKYIPLVLALMGDTSDNIPGIRGIGPAKAIKLIEKNNIPYNIDGIKSNLSKMPEIIKKNIDKIVLNLKLISFDEQIKRLPKDFL